MKLNNAFLQGLKTTGKAQKHFDGGGLYIHVSPQGGKLWRLSYRFTGKFKTLSFGAYPAVSLKDARLKREEAKELLAKDIDPGTHKKAVKAAIKAREANSFEIVAREWHDKYKSSWKATHGNVVLHRLEVYIFPIIGAIPINEITHTALLKTLQRVEERSADTAKRLLQYIGRIFKYGIITERCDRDLTLDLRGALSPVRHDNFSAITEPKKVGELLRVIDSYYDGHIAVRAALRIAPYVFVRPGELRAAEWQEFDFDNCLWVIPAERMKMKQPHYVPMASQVISILEDLRQYTGDGRYLFPALTGKAQPISNATLLRVLRRMGYDKETMTVHGFRHMASTLLNGLGYNKDWIERQLSHGDGNSIRAVYNKADFWEQRKAMMQEFANYLDSLKNQKD
ncbi:MAG: tyrosine-type recombinase/integrase [Deferribacteraceae bacterium]|jgi:integrase|nr:tyrosine-type recombinase/integrase [Deferribacteraceae bacterium]